MTVQLMNSLSLAVGDNEFNSILFALLAGDLKGPSPLSFEVKRLLFALVLLAGDLAGYSSLFFEVSCLLFALLAGDMVGPSSLPFSTLFGVDNRLSFSGESFNFTGVVPVKKFILHDRTLLLAILG